MSVTIRRTWHYGRDRSVTLFSGESLVEALESAQSDMPADHFRSALVALRSGVSYREWSWYTFEAVKPAHVHTGFELGAL